MNRNHVHFAIGYPQDDNVISGMRKKCEIFIELDLKKCLEDKMEIFISTNKVILSAGFDRFIDKKYFKKVTNR